MSTSNKSLKQLRANARGQLIGRYSTAIGVSLLVGIIELIVLQIVDSAYTGSIGSYLLRLVITFIVDLLTGIFIYGQSRFYLNLARNKEPLMVSDVFYGFRHNMDKAVMVQVVFTIASFIGSIPAVLISIGVVPVTMDNFTRASALIYAFNFLVMFIAKLFFGLSFYILADNPELSALEIFAKSMELMKNRKGKYFLLYLSAVPLFILGFLSLFIGVLWAAVFLQAVIANFYLDAISEEPADPFKRETEVTEDIAS